MNYASMCDGIGAVHVAWPGWECAWTAEIEPFPAAVVEHHFNYPNLGDITEIADAQLEQHGPINLLVGGTPCQDFSVAGLRAGMAAPRGNLALAFLGLVDRTRPEWVVWENVPGVLSSNESRDFGTFLGALGKLGYGFAYRVLDAQHFGVPQRRRRVFVVGHSRDWRCAAAVLFERSCLSGDPAPRREAGTRAARAPEIGTDIARAIRTPSGGIDREDMHTLIAHSLRAEGFDASEASDPIYSEELAQPITNRNGDPGTIAFSCKDHGADAAELSPTLRAMGHDGSHANAGGQVAVAFHENQRAEITISETAGALKSGGGKPGQGYSAVSEGSSVRRLTPRECERLQGFPDDYTLVEYRGKPAADGPRYKALGNSMAVPVMRWIGERVERVA